jgi:hypothetical protein
VTERTLVEALEAAKGQLKDIEPVHVAAVVRRVVDNDQQVPKLEVAAFNSAI